MVALLGLGFSGSSLSLSLSLSICVCMRVYVYACVCVYDRWREDLSGKQRRETCVWREGTEDE